jgi:hypothetical protein
MSTNDGGGDASKSDEERFVNEDSQTTIGRRLSERLTALCILVKILKNSGFFYQSDNRLFDEECFYVFVSSFCSRLNYFTLSRDKRS